MESYFGNKEKCPCYLFSNVLQVHSALNCCISSILFMPEMLNTYRHTYPHGYTNHIKKKTSTLSCEAELLSFVISNVTFWLKRRKVLGTPSNLLISLRWDRTMLILTWWAIKSISYKKAISSFSVNKLALLFTVTVRVLTLNRQLLCEVWRAAGSDALL